MSQECILNSDWLTVLILQCDWLVSALSARPMVYRNGLLKTIFQWNAEELFCYSGMHTQARGSSEQQTTIFTTSLNVL